MKTHSFSLMIDMKEKIIASEIVEELKHQR